MAAARERILLVAPSGAARDDLQRRLQEALAARVGSPGAPVETCERLSQARALLAVERDDSAAAALEPAGGGLLLVVAGPLGRAPHADLHACCGAAPTLIVLARRARAVLGDLLACGVRGVLAADNAAAHLAPALATLRAGERFLDRSLTGRPAA